VDASCQLSYSALLCKHLALRRPTYQSVCYAKLAKESKLANWTSRLIPNTEQHAQSHNVATNAAALSACALARCQGRPPALNDGDLRGEQQSSDERAATALEPVVPMKAGQRSGSRGGDGKLVLLVAP
jgi:hypothetical protein